MVKKKYFKNLGRKILLKLCGASSIKISEAIQLLSSAISKKF